MNRFLRRLRRFGKSYSQDRSQGEMVDRSSELNRPGTPQDVANARAKNQRHGKVTADKWNQ